jgi:excisionase family DNA binding protein
MVSSKELPTMNTEPNQMTAPPDYETKSQVARRLNVSRRTIDNLMKQRRLPFINLTSKIVRFPKAEVDAYLAQNFQIKANGQGRNK